MVSEDNWTFVMTASITSSLVPPLLEVSENDSGIVCSRERWTAWKTPLESYALITKLEEENPKFWFAVLIQCFSAVTITLVKSLTFEDESHRMQVDKVLELLENHFVGEENEIFESVNFFTRQPSASWAPVVQHWTSVGSPVGPDGAKMSFGHSPARHLQETKSHKTFSWNKGKSILFTQFRPLTTSGSACFSNRAPLIWNFLPQPIRTCTSYTSFKSHFLDLILKSWNILAFAIYDTNIYNPVKMGVYITIFVFPLLPLS